MSFYLITSMSLDNNDIFFHRSAGRDTIEDLLLYLPDMLKCEMQYELRIGKDNTYRDNPNSNSHLSTNSIEIVAKLYNKNLESVFFSSIQEKAHPTFSIGLKFVSGSQDLWQQITERTREYFSLVNTKPFQRAPYKEIRKYHNHG